MLCVSRLALLSLLAVAVVYVSAASAESDSCLTNERPNPTGKCVMTCNACRDCGPCLCKTGYMRKSLDEDCVTEEDCHKLHFDWMKEAKYQHKQDKFFNCNQNK